ncbi:ATP-binding cassette domain-containing protein [Thermococcus sp.]|uniref:ATP-binding cassette domain-containing protein n=1 Tax=Thermococcus sp. TaxID=35749 RepID=UPI00261ADD65|nr:ATP-binding cassette domain-containing protein [Thermococcus sp.]
MRSVDGLSLSVEEGEVFGSLGPNGAGKTTMVKILVKIIKDYEGTVRSSERISRSGENGHHNKIGVSFEFPAVYSKLTALENLEFFASFYKRTPIRWKSSRWSGLKARWINSSPASSRAWRSISSLV